MECLWWCNWRMADPDRTSIFWICKSCMRSGVAFDVGDHPLAALHHSTGDASYSLSRVLPVESRGGLGLTGKAVGKEVLG